MSKIAVQLNEAKPLPQGWRWVRLDEVCNSESGVWGDVPDNSRYCYPILRSNNIQDGKIILDDVALRRVTEPHIIEAKSLRAGDILVTTSSGSKDLLGKSALFLQPSDGQKYLFSNFTMRLKPKTEVIEPTFLHFYLQSPREKQVLALLQDTTTGLRNLDRKEFLAQTIPLPPLPEQKRIAAKVQELMEEVERAHTACEAQLEAAKALPSAYLREVFESEEAKKWERKRLGEVANVFSGSSAPQDSKYFEDGMYPFVRVQDLGRIGRTLNLTDVQDVLNDTAVRELSLVKAEAGTILFPKSGAAIHTNSRAVLGIDAYIVSHLAAVKPNKRVVSSDWIYFWLCTKDMADYSDNIGYPSLKLSVINSMTIPLPHPNTQQHLASELKDKIAYAEKLKVAAERQLETIKALQQAILRKAFSGEL